MGCSLPNIVTRSVDPTIRALIVMDKDREVRGMAEAGGGFVSPMEWHLIRTHFWNSIGKKG